MRTNPSNFEFPQPEPSLRTAEVARALGVSARAIRTWADEGKIACYRTFGGHRLFAASEVRRVLASWGGESLAGMDHDESSVFAVADRPADRPMVDADQESDAAHG
jgi:excisionase family DNA binding protein